MIVPHFRVGMEAEYPEVCFRFRAHTSMPLPQDEKLKILDRPFTRSRSRSKTIYPSKFRLARFLTRDKHS